MQSASMATGLPAEPLIKNKFYNLFQVLKTPAHRDQKLFRYNLWNIFGGTDFQEHLFVLFKVVQNWAWRKMSYIRCSGQLHFYNEWNPQNSPCNVSSLRVIGILRRSGTYILAILYVYLLYVFYVSSLCIDL